MCRDCTHRSAFVTQALGVCGFVLISVEEKVEEQVGGQERGCSPEERGLWELTQPLGPQVSGKLPRQWHRNQELGGT